MVEMNLSENVKVERYYDSLFTDLTEKISSLFDPTGVVTVEGNETLIQKTLKDFKVENKRRENIEKDSLQVQDQEAKVLGLKQHFKKRVCTGEPEEERKESPKPKRRSF
jgi:hypothetical protein